jgi:DNA-3-methyladenine glycosylase I
MAARSGLGDRLSSALKKRGFSFVGPVIVHAWLQATGVINDHEAHCSWR